jgi:putative transposase
MLVPTWCQQYCAAGRPVNEISRHYGISSATYHKWKVTYGGLEASDVKRLKELEHEDSRRSSGE